MRVLFVFYIVSKKVRRVECLNYSILVCVLIKNIFVYVIFLLFFIGILVGGINMGNVVLWKYFLFFIGKIVDGEMKWKL